jgi:hypothetical protein
LPAAARKEFEALFSPVNIGITAGVLAFWGASHFFGVGLAADVILLCVGLVTIGTQVFAAARDLADFVGIAATARTEADLDLAAGHLAQAVVTVGVTTFVALIMKAGRRLTGRGAVSGQAATAAGEVVIPPAGAAKPWWTATRFGDNWIGTAVPRGFVMETGGQSFRVTANATKHMAEYAARSVTAGQLKNPGVWPTSPFARFAEVDYPLSSLAGALEQAAAKYAKLPPKRHDLERFGNWELGIDTRGKPWIVEHAVPKTR